MLTALPSNTAYFASTWMAGIALLFLGVGVQGSLSPLLPSPIPSTGPSAADEVTIEDFQLPSSAPATTIEQAEETETPVEDFEIPPIPEIFLPITPSEMPEIAVLAPMAEPAPPTESKPKAVNSTSKAKSASKSPPPKLASGASGTGGRGSVTGPATLFTGSGPGYFPRFAYPAAARPGKLQGTVHLSVTVEASGLPTSVSVMSSSGHAILDKAARDTVSRRWRWPRGAGTRKFIVPMHFRLE